MPVRRTYEVAEIHKTKLYKAMVDSGRYDVTDPPIDELVCQYVWLSDKVEECRAIIDSRGVIVEGLHGDVQNPAQASTKASMQMQAIALDQLKKLTASKPAPTDALEEFLGGD